MFSVALDRQYRVGIALAGARRRRGRWRTQGMGGHARGVHQAPATGCHPGRLASLRRRISLSDLRPPAKRTEVRTLFAAPTGTVHTPCLGWARTPHCTRRRWAVPRGARVRMRRRCSQAQGLAKTQCTLSHVEASTKTRYVMRVMRTEEPASRMQAVRSASARFQPRCGATSAISDTKKQPQTAHNVPYETLKYIIREDPYMFPLAASRAHNKPEDRL